MRSHSFLKILVRKGVCWDPTIQPHPERRAVLEQDLVHVVGDVSFGAKGTELGHKAL